MKSLVIFSLFLFLAMSSFAQLTGYWQTENGGCYQIRQNGNEVWWAGEAPGVQRPSNIFHGAVAGNNLTGIWCDLPSSPTQGCGQSLSLRIENNNRMVKLASSSSYNGSVWTRQSGPCERSSGYWLVTAPGGWESKWIPQGTSNIYDAVWTNKNTMATVTTQMSITIDGNKFTGTRISSDDNVYCNYQGIISDDGNSIPNGTGSCGVGTTISWSAVLVK